jgi:outer membrane immunogenic protein
MKKLLVSAFALAVFSGPAIAADLYAPAPVMYDWNGFYLGGHAGYLWGDFDYSAPGGPEGSEAEDISGGIDVDGFVGGIVGGWNFQSGAWVFGVEGDFGWSGADGSESGNVGLDEETPIIGSVDLNWNAHIRGRVGMTLGETGDTLLFIAGGLAIADIDASGSVDSESVSVGGTYTGWSIGGGANHAFNENLIAGIEVLYDDYGSKTYEIDFCNDGCFDDAKTSLDAFTIRGTLTYHFN